MPGRRLAIFRHGELAEYVSQYFLSNISSTIPVPRQEDYGLDFVGAVTHHRGGHLHPTRLFGVQVKSGALKDVSYGGGRKRWKKWEIDWLYGQDVPLFIGLVDAGLHTLRLYSTKRIWWSAWQFGMPFKVVLQPDAQLPGLGLQNRYRRRRANTKRGDKHINYVPLGPPVVTLRASKMKDRGVRAAAARCLEAWIELDQQNIAFWKQNVPYVLEYMRWKSNAAPRGRKKYVVLGNTRPDQNIKQILLAIRPGLTALAFNFKLQKQLDRMESVRPLSRVLRAYRLLDSKLPGILGKA